ncbi:MAG: Large rane protein [Frankiales bacterium]|nr:Large rane protein [Frankiales bacterium]
MKTRAWAPLVTFVAVAGIGGGAALLAGGGRSAGAPRHLKLANADTTAVARSSGSSSDYVLDTTLPTDRPRDQRAYSLAKGPAGEALVAKLAKALGESAPTRVRDGWRAGGLQVSGKPGQAWTWSPCNGAPKDSAIGSDGATTCGVASPPDAGTAPGAVSGSGSSGSGTVVAPPATGSVQPAPDAPPPVTSPAASTPPPDVPASTVREGSREVFAALGLDADDATVHTGPYGGDAVIETAKLDGRTVSGLTNGVTVGQDGKVNGGSGFLGTPAADDSYPVISAQDAYDELPALAHPDICQLPPDGSSGCVEPAKTHITGAELGLSLQYTTDGGAVLVPSWLFATQHGFVSAVAIEKQYRGGGDKPVDPPATNGTDVAPASAAREQVAVQAARAGATSKALVVTYEDGGCGHQNLTAQAKEDDKTVYVDLEADPQAQGVACTTDSRPKDVTLDLQAPLGDRTVIDASTGKAVPLA